MKAQGALEYLIIIAAVLAIAAVTVTFMSGVFGTSSESANIALCRQAAASCDNKLATGVSKSCPECEKSCINPITRRDVIGGTIECGVGCLFCKQGIFYDVTKHVTTSTYNMLYGGVSTTSGNERAGYAVSMDGVHWLKASKDPILPLGPNAFDSTHASCIHPVKISSAMYYGYYGACCDPGWQVGFATSPNGLVWTKAGQPVLKVSPGQWDSTEATNMFVLIESPTDFKGWYLGSGPAAGAIGYATSSDGITWTKYGTGPVMRSSDLPWADPNQRLDYAFVIKEGGVYKMWFSGADIITGGKAIGYATSLNGITWMPSATPALTKGSAAWESSGVYHPFVIHRGATYEMWYAGISGGNIQIGYATSDDGITNWQRHADNPVLKLGAPGDWDSKYVFCPYGLYE
jgi:hypothetical protein